MKEEYLGSRGWLAVDHPDQTIDSPGLRLTVRAVSWAEGGGIRRPLAHRDTTHGRWHPRKGEDATVEAGQSRSRGSATREWQEERSVAGDGRPAFRPGSWSKEGV